MARGARKDMLKRTVRCSMGCPSSLTREEPCLQGCRRRQLAFEAGLLLAREALASCRGQGRGDCLGAAGLELTRLLGRLDAES